MPGAGGRSPLGRRSRRGLWAARRTCLWICLRRSGPCLLRCRRVGSNVCSNYRSRRATWRSECGMPLLSSLPSRAGVPTGARRSVPPCGRPSPRARRRSRRLARTCWSRTGQAGDSMRPGGPVVRGGARASRSIGPGRGGACGQAGRRARVHADGRGRRSGLLGAAGSPRRTRESRRGVHPRGGGGFKDARGAGHGRRDGPRPVRAGLRPLAGAICRHQGPCRPGGRACRPAARAVLLPVRAAPRGLPQGAPGPGCGRDLADRAGRHGAGRRRDPVPGAGVRGRADHAGGGGLRRDGAGAGLCGGQW